MTTTHPKEKGERLDREKECLLPLTSVRKRQCWMVGIDDSPNAYYAFHFACANMNPERDHLLLVGVAQEQTLSLGDVTKTQRKHIKRVLAFYRKEADTLGICNSLVLGQYKHIGETLCLIAERLRVNQLVLGRRSMMDIKRLLVGSTSKYVVENANCNVAVVRHPIEMKEEECVTFDKLADCFNQLHVKTSGVSKNVRDDDEFSRDKICERDKDGKVYLYIFRGQEKELKRKEINIVSEHKGREGEKKGERVGEKKGERMKDIGEKKRDIGLEEKRGERMKDVGEKKGHEIGGQEHARKQSVE
jgi:nucleotide-binding universal stress UspA family protein